MVYKSGKKIPTNKLTNCAPALIPIIPGSAKGFFSTTWNNKPAKASAHPTSIVTMTRGKRIW